MKLECCMNYENEIAKIKSSLILKLEVERERTHLKISFVQFYFVCSLTLIHLCIRNNNWKFNEYNY